MTDPDPGGPKTYGSSGSRSTTLEESLCFDGVGCGQLCKTNNMSGKKRRKKLNMEYAEGELLKCSLRVRMEVFRKKQKNKLL
jgi:hypothetical protein